MRYPALLSIAAIAALGVTLPVVSAQAQATRTWVSGVGDDVNPCSRTAPCKTFAGAISKTAAGGKINCLDPGGFGAVTITKSIEIDCFAFPGGILNAGTNGVNVNTAGVKVVLRGIEIHGGGTGVNGVNITAGADVTLDKCFIIAQTGNGVNVSLTVAGTANVIVIDTNITQVNNGISFSATGGGAALGHFRNVDIHKVAASGVVLATGNTFATVSHSMLTGNVTGGLVSGNGAQMNVVSSIISYNTTGLNASVSGATVRMSDNDILNNTTSTAVVAGATLASPSPANNRVNPTGAAPNSVITTQ
jgi:hypothetical protein